MYTCIFTRIRICSYVYMVHVHICIFVCLCMYVFMYVFIQLFMRLNRCWYRSHNLRTFVRSRRAELKAMYRKTIFTARRDATKHHHKHAAPHISSSSTTLHDEVAPEQDDSNDGAYTGFGTKGARGVAGSGSSGAGQLIGDTHAGEQEFGRGRTAWNRCVSVCACVCLALSPRPLLF